MTLTTAEEQDLSRHLCDRVRQAVDDALQLTDDLGLRARLAIMAASVPIGTAGANLAVKARLAGREITETQATVQVLDFLKMAQTDGPDAAMAKFASDG